MLTYKDLDGKIRISECDETNYEEMIHKCVDRLYEYERIGVEPKKLREILREYAAMKRAAKNAGTAEAAPAKARFAKPTIEEVRAYCRERGNGVDAEAWYAHYEACGWKVGRNPMKDWKAAVRTWERNGVGKAAKAPAVSSFDTDDFFAAAMARSYKEVTEG